MICNQRVGGSSPFTGSIVFRTRVDKPQLDTITAGGGPWVHSEHYSNTFGHKVFDLTATLLSLGLQPLVKIVVNLHRSLHISQLTRKASLRQLFGHWL
jgi:hypothetical protein